MSNVDRTREVPVGPDRPGGPRRSLVRAGAGVVAVGVVAVVVVALVSAGGGDDAAHAPRSGTTSVSSSSAATPSATAASATAAAAAATSAVTTASAAASPAGAEATAATASTTADGSPDLPPALPPVAADRTVAVGPVTVSVVSLESVQGSGSGPGNVSGPAVRVTVRLVNGSGERLSVDGAVVTLVYGDQATPASPLEDSSERRFAGSLAAGRSVEGVYVFSVPTGDQSHLQVQVGYQPAASVAVFTGAAG